jgi:hypothetical protein
MIPGDTIKRKKMKKDKDQDQQIDPFSVARRNHKHYWIALWIMSIVLALAIAFYLFEVLRPSQQISFAKVKMRLPSKTTDEDDTYSASIRAFLLNHPEYGSFENTSNMPDWESGKWKKVTTSNGNYLFYFEGSEIVSVHAFLPDEKSEIIFRKK